MRIAVVSDIHGNLLALDAVVDDMQQQSPDEVWCGGDLAWGGPWPSECIERVRSEGWVTVRGNTDVWITGDPQTLKAEKDRKALNDMAAAHNISSSDAQWLIRLPLGHSGKGSILLVHGTPDSPFYAPEPAAEPAAFAPYQGKAAIVIYGHVHRAFVRRLGDGTIVCNPGSVGLPQDAETASYLIIDQRGAEWSLSHRRVAFDRRAGIARARQIGGPLGASFLRSMGEV